MALTKKELEIVDRLKTQGYSSEQIQAHIGAHRAGRTSSIDGEKAKKGNDVDLPSKRAQSFGDYRKTQPQFDNSETMGDLKEFGAALGGGASDAQARFDKAWEDSFAYGASTRAEGAHPMRNAIQATGQAIGDITEGVVGGGVMAAGKALLPQEAEEGVEEGFEWMMEKAVDTKTAAKAIDWWQQKSPEEQEDLSGLFGYVEFGTTFATGGLMGSVWKALKSKAPKAAKKLTESDEILRSKEQPDLTKELPDSPKVADVYVEDVLAQTVKDVRMSISDIDPQIETALKRSTHDEVNKYFQHAKGADADTRLDTPMEIAGQRAIDAYDVVSDARIKAIQGKNEILNKVGNQRVKGDVINNVMADGLTTVADKYGVKVLPDGTLERLPGRYSKLDGPDEKLIKDYFSRLNALGVAPTIRQIDDFVDWAQSTLYKQSKTLSKYEVASDPLVRTLRGINGSLNARLRQEVADAGYAGYGEVNARIGKMIEWQDELSRMIGADGRKGAGMMKKVFSPDNANTRKNFNEIYKATGIDLHKEAALAKFAMESVGDVRQKSILKELDLLIEGTNQIDLTKPGTWWSALKEYGDLDGEDLAHEIVRQSGKELSPTDAQKAGAAAAGAGAAFMVEEENQAYIAPGAVAVLAGMNPQGRKAAFDQMKKAGIKVDINSEWMDPGVLVEAHVAKSFDEFARATKGVTELDNQGLRSMYNAVKKRDEDVLMNALEEYKLAASDVSGAGKGIEEALSKSPETATKLAEESKKMLKAQRVTKLYRYGDEEGMSWSMKPQEFFKKGGDGVDRELIELELTDDVLERVIYVDGAEMNVGYQVPLSNMGETEVILKPKKNQ